MDDEMNPMMEGMDMEEKADDMMMAEEESVDEVKQKL